VSNIIHRAESRGVAEHGWLHSRHTFSFAEYYDRDRMGFGVLRVLNDDIVEPGMGFGTHPHENMEIVSIPLAGCLRHDDSMGNEHIISTGEVQIMSAGTGITHSEYNNSDTEPVNFLQIWVLPKERNITPRYDQRVFDPQDRVGQFQLLVSPDGASKSVLINQDAWFSMADIGGGDSVPYELSDSANGVYLFVIDGDLVADSTALSKRDGLGVIGCRRIDCKASSAATVLCIEVPMD
jgi:redox-sensitive bicupin YhaK (pirin superfamily)